MLYLQIQQHISLLRHVKPSFGEAQCLHISECKLNNTESLRRCVYHFSQELWKSMFTHVQLKFEYKKG